MSFFFTRKSLWKRRFSDNLGQGIRKGREKGKGKLAWYVDSLPYFPDFGVPKKLLLFKIRVIRSELKRMRFAEGESASDNFIW